MAKITDKSLVSKVSKDRISISCRSFLKELSKRDKLLDVGRMFIKMQFTLKGVGEINSDLEDMVKKESAAVLQVSAKKISTGMEKLVVGLKRKQEEEKSGKNKKASTEGLAMVKAMNSFITDLMGYLGSDIRIRIEAALKKKKIKAKISTVGQNQFNKIKLMRSAFSAAPVISYDKKTWGNIAKAIHDLAFATGNKTVEEYIQLSDTVKVNILKYDKETDDKKKTKAEGDLRSTLVSYTQSIKSFLKEIKDAKILTKATAEMKKQKGGLDKRGKALLKRMDELHTSNTKMQKEIFIYKKKADEAIKLLEIKDDRKLKPMASTFETASKTMKSMSSQAKRLAKNIQVDAKKNIKKA